MRDVESLFTRKEQFRDFDVRFMRNPVTGDLVTLSTTDSIRQAVKLLILTSFYERPFQPKIGTRIRGSLFELFDVDLADTIKEEISSIIASYEPRASIQDIQIAADPYAIDSNSLSVKISFLIYGKVQRVDQTINLNRIR